MVVLVFSQGLGKKGLMSKATLSRSVDTSCAVSALSSAIVPFYSGSDGVMETVFLSACHLPRCDADSPYSLVENLLCLFKIYIFSDILRLAF